MLEKLESDETLWETDVEVGLREVIGLKQRLSALKGGFRSSKSLQRRLYLWAEGCIAAENLTGGGGGWEGGAGRAAFDWGCAGL